MRTPSASSIHRTSEVVDGLVCVSIGQMMGMTTDLTNYLLVGRLGS